MFVFFVQSETEVVEPSVIKISRCVRNYTSAIDFCACAQNLLVDLADNWWKNGWCSKRISCKWHKRTRCGIELVSDRWSTAVIRNWSLSLLQLKKFHQTDDEDQVCVKFGVISTFKLLFWFDLISQLKARADGCWLCLAGNKSRTCGSSPPEMSCTNTWILFQENQVCLFMHTIFALYNAYVCSVGNLNWCCPSVVFGCCKIYCSLQEAMRGSVFSSVFLLSF